jgi:hypothetical protein
MSRDEFLIGFQYLHLVAKKDKHVIAFQTGIDKLNKLGWDIYFNINPPRKKLHRRVRASDVDHVSGILVDYDRLFTKEEAQEFIEETSLNLWLRNAGAIWTGRGVQLIIPILSPDVPEDWPRVVRAFLAKHAPAADQTVCDVARLARVPETINWKTGNKGFIGRIPKATYDAKQIINEVGPLPPIEKPAPPPVALNDSANLWEIEKHLTVTARIWLEQGAPKGARHGHAYACAASLRDIGMSPERTIELLRWGNLMCHERLSDYEINKIAVEVFRVQQRHDGQA